MVPPSQQNMKIVFGLIPSIDLNGATQDHSGSQPSHICHIVLYSHCTTCALLERSAQNLEFLHVYSKVIG